jgi:hypothetical protein
MTTFGVVQKQMKVVALAPSSGCQTTVGRAAGEHRSATLSPSHNRYRFSCSSSDGEGDDDGTAQAERPSMVSAPLRQ